ncbi:MAG: hypothetical protein ACU0A8_07560 [Limimaricola soesokkakensis]|uniref:hypothetical protein n=1 Tax=Limimaricola soesokkakensis TaxID=1343159 RepID=UPI004058BDE1
MTTSPSLEDLAFATIRSGRALARSWGEAGLDNRGASHSLCSAACNRLAAGQLLRSRDHDVVAVMGETLRRALNAERPGYGDHAMSEDTRYDTIFFQPRLEELRRLAEVYKHFRACQERYADRLTAERLAARAF